MRLKRYTIADLCQRADIQYRVSGGAPPSVSLWDVPEHGYTVDADGTRAFPNECEYTTQKLGEIWLHPGLRVLDSDNNDAEVQNQTWERAVGQRVNITADKPFDQETISSCNWNVPNGLSPYEEETDGPQAAPSAAPGATGSYSTADGPTSANWYWSASVQENDRFITALIFRPTAGPGGQTLSNTIWVPLAAFDWSFDGTAVNSGGWAWALSPSPAQQPSLGTYSSATNPNAFTATRKFPGVVVDLARA